MELTNESSSTIDMLPSVSARRPLSLLQLVLLNSIVCGLEFCASAGFTYIPPMLLKSGIEEEHMSIILGMGPLFALIFVPVIGRASDRCQSRFGRRRPFILILSLMLIISLCIIPYGDLAGTYLFGQSDMNKKCAVFLLICGAVLLDFTSQACLTPCEALLSDATRNTTQQERCFTIYSFMVSLGGCIGYLITALDWSSSSVGLYFGGQEQSAFSLLIMLFTFSMVATLCIAEERPTDRINSSNGNDDFVYDINEKLDQIHQVLVMHKGENGAHIGYDPGYESGSNQSDDVPQLTSSSDSKSNNPLLPNGRQETAKLETLKEQGVIIERQNSTSMVLRSLQGLNKCCSLPLRLFRFPSCIKFIFCNIFSSVPFVFSTFFNVPEVLKRLALANFFSWTAVMCFNLFYTDFVGQAVYGGNPNAPEDSPLRALYDEGVRMGSWGLLLHCITSAMYVAILEKLVDVYGPRTTYLVGMVSFTMAMCSMLTAKTVVLVNIMASITGLAFATVTTIPFTLVNTYHEHKEIYYYDVNNGNGLTNSRKEQRGIGGDMATLDTAYFISQIMLSAVMGYIVSWTGSVYAYIVVSASAGLAACFFILRIIHNKQEVLKHISRTTSQVSLSSSQSVQQIT